MRRLFSLAISILLLAAVSAAAQREERKSRDDWQQPARVVQELHLNAGDIVADIGCGRGYFTFRLAEAVGKTGKILGVDIDEKALDALKTRAQREQVGNIEVIHSEPTDTKLAPDSVDAAFICMVMHHVPKEQQQLLLGSVAKAIKPGGYLYVIDIRRDIESPLRWHGEQVRREDLIEKATAEGLVLDADFYCLPYQYFVRFTKPEAQE